MITVEITDVEFQVIHMLRSLVPHDRMEVSRSGNRITVIIHRSYKEDFDVIDMQSGNRGNNPPPTPK